MALKQQGDRSCKFAHGLGTLCNAENYIGGFQLRILGFEIFLEAVSGRVWTCLDQVQTCPYFIVTARSSKYREISIQAALHITPAGLPPACTIPYPVAPPAAVVEDSIFWACSVWTRSRHVWTCLDLISHHLNPLKKN